MPMLMYQKRVNGFIYIFQKKKISLSNFINECDVRIGHINKNDLVMHDVEKMIFQMCLS